MQYTQEDIVALFNPTASDPIKHIRLKKNWPLKPKLFFAT